MRVWSTVVRRQVTATGSLAGGVLGEEGVLHEAGYPLRSPDFP